ncbi:MAG: hypothetical protein LBE36_02250 [Flavobacteriaceae bacterium]|jgi:hypothetical protein|nr:hypothetical protein [Flavobacteriaceae bacterium]
MENQKSNWYGRKIIALFLICFVFLAKAQNVTLDELINLRKHDLAYVEEYLAKKGWVYLSTIEYGIVFTNPSISNNRVTVAIIIYRYYADDIKTLQISTNNTNKYLSYVDRIKSFGCKLIDSYEEKETGIVKEYRGATTTFIVTNEGYTNVDIFDYFEEYGYDVNKNFYTIGIFSNDDYDIIQMIKKQAK